MTKTKYYDLQMDDPQDDYDVEVVNANLKKIDEQMKTRENATDALQEPEFTVAEKRENIASKEKMPKILGKIAKFFTDLKTVAFSGKYSDLDGKPAIVNNNTATEAGSALDARQANPTIEGTMANQISQLNSDLLVKKYYGKLIATDLVKFRTELAVYNSIYVYGHLVIISFSVLLNSNIGGGLQDHYWIVTLPDLLYGKIEWNNLCGSFAYSRACPFVFSDNTEGAIILMVPNTTVSAGDELRVWGIGFLNP